MKTSCKIATEEEEALVAEHLVTNSCDQIGHNFKSCRQLVNFWEDVKVLNLFHWKL